MAGVEQRWHIRARTPASNVSVYIATKQRNHDVYNNITMTQMFVTSADRLSGRGTLPFDI